MAFRHYTLTLTGSAQRLSDVLPNLDQEPFQQQISLQPDGANSNPIYVGGAGVTSSDFGVRLESGDTGVPPAPFLISDTFKPAGAKLSDIWVLGTNTQKLHILCNPYGG